jgi:trehalose 6-phosphate synthase/phosphatase
LRPRGVGKGLYVRHLRTRGVKPPAILAAGDDLTDADLFAALPPGSIALHVGGRIAPGAPGDARLEEYAVDNPAQLRSFLARLAADAGVALAPPVEPAQ